MDIQKQNITRTQQDGAAWILNADQMTFMLRHHNVIEAAYESGDVEFLRQLAASETYLSAFGSMGWDEAYDRYEIFLSDNLD